MSMIYRAGNEQQYTTSNGVLVPFDGDGMREYQVDKYVRDYSDPPHVEGLKAGSLLEVPSGKKVGLKGFRHDTFVWFIGGRGFLLRHC